MVSLDDDLLGLVLLAATDEWREHNTLSCCIMVNRNWRDLCSPNKTQEYYLWVRRNAPTCIPRIVVQRLIREAACAHSNLRYFQTAPRFSRDAVALLHTELEQFACELLAGSNPLYEAILRGDTACTTQTCSPRIWRRLNQYGFLALTRSSIVEDLKSGASSFV